MSLQTVLKEICVECEYQDGMGGVEFDDCNTLNDWVTYIAIYTGQAARMDVLLKDQRKNMLKAATLAVAAIASFDRNGQFAPRHYEDRTLAGIQPDDESPVIPEAWGEWNSMAAQKPAESRFACISLHGEIAIIRVAIEQLINGVKTDADLIQRSKSLSELMQTIERLIKAAAAMDRQFDESGYGSL